MADEPMVPAPESGITEPTQTQPQADPVSTPEGTPVPDDQQGTTGDEGKAAREALYQTKYQSALEDAKALAAELNTYQQTYGPLNPESQPEPAQPQGQDEQEFDPYNPETIKRYHDAQYARMQANFAKVAREVLVQTRIEERQAEARQAVSDRFNTWCNKHQVGPELQEAAAREYQARWGNAGTPKAVFEFLTDHIAKQMAMQGDQANIARLQAEAAEKAKMLAGAELPAQGATPGLAATEKPTPAQAWADDIAPDDIEPKFD